LEIDLLRGFLEMDISELTDHNINLCFEDARRLIEHGVTEMFTRQLSVVVQLMSITASYATLASLVNRKSWPILGLMASIPLLKNSVAPLFTWLKAWANGGTKTS